MAENGDSMEQIAHSMEHVRINNGNGNGNSDGQSRGRGRNGKQSRNGYGQNRNGGRMDTKVSAEAQLKTGFPLHQDPAIIAFSSSGPAYGGIPEQSLLGTLLPAGYKGSPTGDARAQAYGSYVECVPERRPRQARQTQPAAESEPQNGEPEASDEDQVTRPGYVINKKGIYVRGLEQDIDDAGLRARFEPFGGVLQCKVHVDLRTRVCLGYGFVEFADERSASAAIDAYAKDPQRRMQVSAMRMPAPDMTNVYVRNLPLNMIDRDLENMFSAFGKVVSVRILRHPNGVSQGVGFARMSSQSECQRIIDTYNGSCLPGSPQPLVVKFADDSSAKRTKPRNEREHFASGVQVAAQPPFERAVFSAAAHKGQPPTHFNNRNGSVHQGVYQHPENAGAFPPQVSHQYMPPNGPQYANGYYHTPNYAQQSAYAGNFNPSFDHPPNSAYQQQAPASFVPNAAPAQFAPAGYNNVPISNIFMYPQAGQPQQVANSDARPPFAMPYADPAIIAVRNGARK